MVDVTSNGGEPIMRIGAKTLVVGLGLILTWAVTGSWRAAMMSAKLDDLHTTQVELVKVVDEIRYKGIDDRYRRTDAERDMRNHIEMHHKGD